MDNDGYRIWFKNWDENIFIALPVNPNEVTVTYPANASNYDVEGIGEIIIPRRPKLRTVTFESFFPRQAIFTPLANNDVWYTPEWYVNFFSRMQKSRSTVEMTISRGSEIAYDYGQTEQQNISLAEAVQDYFKVKDPAQPSVFKTDYFSTTFKQAVILDFSITDRGGEPGDIYYSLVVSEYKDASPKTLAEIASQTKNEKGEIVEQKLVQVVNRPQQSGAITTGRNIEINGKVWTSEDELRDGWNKTKQVANRVNAVTTRVLPPQVSNSLHSVYVDGLGWVNKADCRLAESKGTSNRIQRIIRNDQ